MSRECIHVMEVKLYLLLTSALDGRQWPALLQPLYPRGRNLDWTKGELHSQCECDDEKNPCPCHAAHS